MQEVRFVGLRATAAHEEEDDSTNLENVLDLPRAQLRTMARPAITPMTMPAMAPPEIPLDLPPELLLSFPPPVVVPDV
jgi:hypothetical protein